MLKRILVGIGDWLSMLALFSMIFLIVSLVFRAAVYS